MRPLFTDGFNSVAHLGFGVLAAQFAIIGVLFLVYQVYDIFDVNFFIDMAEFCVGYLCVSIPKLWIMMT